MIIVGNKCEKEKERSIDKSEPISMLQGQTSCCFIEASAKKNINIEDIFVRLFESSNLPMEMSPSCHRQVQPSYVGSTGSPSARRGVSIRRKTSDACGTIAPNVRRPSIRTDLMVAQMRRHNNSMDLGGEDRDSKCVIQ
jgi:dexamethasone-induced Ras-related protein 1